jgi:predicted transposase YbfD/YdcC
VPDHRCRRGRRYEQALVLTLLLVAKLAGEKTLSGTAQWVRHRSEWLGQVFAHVRFPCANTYGNICAAVDAEELNQRLADFFRLRQSAATTDAEGRAGAEPPCSLGLRHLACDGKELRGTHRQGKTGSAVLGIYDVTSGAMSAQLSISGKGHEQAALCAWLKGRDLRNCLVTADALHTQTKVCQLIREQQGEYLLIAKQNQPQLLEALETLFAAPEGAGFPEQSARSAEKAHGRHELRCLRSSCVLNAYLADRWCDVAQVFQVERTITKRGSTTRSVVYGLTSLPSEQASAAHLLHLVRAHWAIENKSHWRRDATLGEDACKVSSTAAAATLAALNSALLALVDIYKIANLRTLIRRFAAKPHEALQLLLTHHPDF